MSSGLSLEKILKLNDKEFNVLLRSPKKEYSPDKRRKEFEAKVPALAKKWSNSRYKNYKLLWEQYHKENIEGNPYGYTQFKHIIQEHLKSQDYAFHHFYEPGFQLQVDFAGDKLYYIKNIKTGERQRVYVLCCCMPATSFSFVYGMMDMTMENFYHGLSKCLEYLGGIPAQVKSDNMAQYVKRYDRYEPTMTVISVCMHRCKKKRSIHLKKSTHVFLSFWKNTIIHDSKEIFLLAMSDF